MSNYTDKIGQLANRVDPLLVEILNDLATGNADRDQTIKNLTATLATITTLTATTVNAGNLAGAFDGGATLAQISLPYQEITTTGTAILGTTSSVLLNKSDGVLASTLTAPSTGRLLLISQYDAGTSGHTVTLGSGTFDGTNNIATFNAAGETLLLYGLTAARFLVLINNGSVAFSGG